MERNKKVSIICVTKNAEKHLEGCLQSIQQQSTDDYEIIVQDGGSTDGTIKILQKWADHIAFWTSEPDNGIYDAMNKAIRKASGRWIYFIGADDRLLAEFSEVVDTCLEKDNTVYYANALVQGNRYYGRFSSYKLAKHNICHQAMFFPRSVFPRYSFDLQYTVCADYVLNMQLFHDKSFPFQFVDKLIATFNDTGHSAVCQDARFENVKKTLIWRYLGCWTYVRYCNRLRKEKIRQRKTVDK